MSASYSASRSAMFASAQPASRLLRRLAVASVVAPAPTAAIKFGTLTPPGEGEQSIDAADGAYDVGGGQFSVSSNRIGIVVMPSAGTYSIDGVDVEVVAGARTCSTASEIAAMWMAADGLHPAGTKILLAPGTYTVFPLLSGLNNRLLNSWIWQAVDSENPPLITAESWNSQNPYFADDNNQDLEFYDIEWYRPQDPIGIAWNPVLLTCLVLDHNGTALVKNCRFYSNLVPAALGGKFTSQVIGLVIGANCSVTVQDSKLDHLGTGVQLEGEYLIENNTFENIYSDFFQPRAGHRGVARNNHSVGKIGDGTYLHGDWIQLQTPPNSPITGPSLWEGNTFTPGPFWETAAGQAHASKTWVIINTPGPHLMTIADHHGYRALRVFPATAGGQVDLTLPKASTVGKDVTFCVLQVENGGNVVITKQDPTDTVEDSLLLESNNESTSFISDGVSHWKRIPPGYRATTQIRTEDKVLGVLENGVGVYSDDSLGNRVFTLENTGNHYFVTAVKKDTTSNFTTTARLPAGYTAVDHGQVIVGPHDFVLGRCGEVMEFERQEGSTEWLVTEKTTTSQGWFSNGPGDGYTGLTIRYNIFLVNSPRGISPGPVPYIGNSRCYNNTVLRIVPPDSNNDGFIAASDSWNEGTVGSLWLYEGLESFRNAITGQEVEEDDISVLKRLQNQSFGWDDPEDLSALNVYLQASVPTDIRPVTRAEVVAAARAKVGGPLVIDAPSYSYIGAVGTTSSNGPYNWDTGTVNTNTKTPLLQSTTPTDGDTGVFTDTTIVLVFDELIRLGTGNIEIREVGGEVIETFDVAVSGQLAIGFGDDGTKLTITPTSSLPTDTNVCIRIASTAINGFFNAFLGITDDSLNFTTVANNPTVYVHDEFTEASNTALASRTPDVDLVGGGWSALFNGSTVSVKGGLGYANWDTVFGSGQPDLYSINTGVADYRVELSVFIGTVNQRINIPIRAVDSQNHWYLQFRAGDAAEGVILYKRIANSLSLVTQITGTDGEGDPNYLINGNQEDIVIVCQGTTIQVYFHNKLKMTFSTATELVATGTRVGIGARNTGPQFLSFTCEEIV